MSSNQYTFSSSKTRKNKNNVEKCVIDMNQLQKNYCLQKGLGLRSGHYWSWVPGQKRFDQLFKSFVTKLHMPRDFRNREKIYRWFSLPGFATLQSCKNIHNLLHGVLKTWLLPLVDVPINKIISLAFPRKWR